MSPDPPMTFDARLELMPWGRNVCVLAPADPDHVPVPDDVLDALEEAGRRKAFERKPAPERRRLLAPVEGAARPATRERRIAALVASLPTD